MRKYTVVIEKLLTYTAEVEVWVPDEDHLNGSPSIDALRRGFNVAKNRDPLTHLLNWELTGESLEAIQALDPNPLVSVQ